MDGFIDSIEWVAAFFIGLVALDVFLSRCCCATFFGYTIPDAYDFGQLLLGIRDLLGHRRDQLSRDAHHGRPALGQRESLPGSA
jgi:hypothetical protein